MDLFWKATAMVLITVILGLALGKQCKDMALLLAIGSCCMVCVFTLTYLEPVLDYLKELDTIGTIQEDMLGILLRAAGIGLVAEIAGMLCADGGSASLGKSIQLLGSTAILYLSLPILRAMMEIMQKILGEL